jgi:hypothetical protein
MTAISFTIEQRPVERLLNDLEQRQFPFAMALTLTTMASKIRVAEQDEMRRVFDKPTPWILRSIRYDRATKQNLQARVYVNDDGVTSEGRAVTVIRNQIKGGARGQKPYERRLTRAGVLPRGWVTVPGNGERLNSYGNLSQGRIVQILSAARAFTESGFNVYQGPSKRSSKVVDRMFVSRGPGMWAGRRQHLPAGVWIRSGRGGRKIRPVLLFLRQASYRPRFDFQGVAQQQMDREFRQTFMESMARALATAR